MQVVISLWKYAIPVSESLKIEATLAETPSVRWLDVNSRVEFALQRALINFDSVSKT